MGRQNLSVCWSQNGRRVLSGSIDGTARQWDVKKGDTILKLIETGQACVWAVIYSPDMNMVVTGGPSTGPESSIKIRNTNTGKLVGLVTLKGDVGEVHCLAWTNDGKTLISVLFICLCHWNISESPHPRRRMVRQYSAIVEPR
ncbi:hypothetical protein C8R48DRAFT_722728 [Suillus tomentosus]|nr:hypothetical protein C8R48DRAFT_722728 [Suillus tomentosus]